MPRSSHPTSALYVRIPTSEADTLDRTSRALGVPKNVLVSRLVATLGEAEDPQSSEAGVSGLTAHRPGTGLSDDPMPVGFYSFRSHELPEVLTAEQAAQLLQLGETVVIRLAETGQLPGRILDGSWRFSRTGLVAWLSSGTGAGAVPTED